MANAYFAANPDVAAAYAQNSYGMTPDEFANAHYQLYGASEQRAAPTTTAVTTPSTTTTQQATSSAETSSPSLFGNLESVARNWEGGRNPIPLNDPIVHIANQILSQGLTSKWTGEGAGSPEANALYMADTLRKAGITDISQFGEIKQTVQGDPIYSDGAGEDRYVIGYGPDKEITTYGNKETGQALANTYGERQTGNAWGGTYAGEGNTAYRVQFDAQGNPFFYTTGASSSDIGSLAPLLTIGSMLVAPGLSGLIGGATGLTGGALAAATGATLGAGTAALTDNDILKGALLGGGAGYLGNTLFGGSNTTDLGMNSNLTMAQIESGLGTPGYGYGAQAASSGLFNPAVIGSGAYTQTSYPYDMADFLAADALQLQGQVGNNLPAIEQNLTASGVDPLVAADVANQVALNPGISQYDLTNYINTTFGGGNIYDVNMATQYPTSQLPGAGGLLSDLPGAGATTTKGGTTTTKGGGTSSGTGLTGTQIANLIRGGLALAGAGSAVSNMGGGGDGGVGGLPTQGVPTGNQDYYNAIQQYYNAYMPAAPRDVATPLQNWYNSKYGA